MSKTPGFDAQALIDQFAQASARQSTQLRQAVHDATLQALQGRELSLKNIRQAVAAVTTAAGAGAAQNSGGQVDALLDNAVKGIDDALLKAVDAHRVALQQFVDRGADLRETQLKKALADLEKMEDTFTAALQKAAGAAGEPLAGAWAQALEKLNLGGSRTGAQASGAVEQLMAQTQAALRDSRAASLKAAQALADSYTALVSGVLIGMADALRHGVAPAAPKATAKTADARKR